MNQIANGKKHKLFREEFVCDKELNFTIDEIDESRFSLSVASGIMGNIEHIGLSTDDDSPGAVSFKYGSSIYEYILPLDIGFYKIDDKGWNTSTTDLWINDITAESKLALMDSHCDGLMVYTENGALAEDNIAIVDKGAYKEIPVGFLKSYQTSNQYVLLVLTANGKKKYSMFCYNRCVIDEERTEVVYSDRPKKVMITPVFHGKNKVFFEVLDKNGVKVYTSDPLASEQTDILKDFRSFEEYTINFYEKAKTLTLKKSSPLYTAKKTFYARTDYIGRVFKIDIAYFHQFKGQQCFEKEYHFNKAFLRVIGIRADGRLAGNIFVKTMKGEWVLDQISPVEVEICSEIVDDTMDVYMTNCGDGLLMDFEKHGIMNSLDHPTAPDIFLYTLSMRET